MRLNADELEDMTQTCSLDVGDAYAEMTLAEVAELLGVTREFIRQIELKAMRKLVEQCGEGIRSAITSRD